jgi:hypothetical protein
MPYVESDAIRIVTYDEIAFELDVTFASGKTYRYSGVPRHVYKELIAAESHGRYFNTYIRDRYRYRRI